jgi:hypothetical protein
MAIKIQNTSVIDDSRNLVNLTSATVFGPTRFDGNSSSGILTIRQQNTGLSLKVVDNTNSVSLTVANNGSVGLGTESPPASTKLLLDGTRPNIGFTQTGVSVNGVRGWTMREEVSTFSIDRRTSADFSAFNAVLAVRSNNMVSINPSASPLVPLTVKSEGIVIQDNDGEGFYIAPGLNSENFIWSRNNIANQNRGLVVVGETIRIYNGASTGSTVTTRITMNSDGTTVVTGALVAAQWSPRPGLDWFYLGSVTASGSAVDLAIDSTYTSYAVVMHRVNGTQDAGLFAELRTNSDLVGTATSYKYNGVAAKSDSTAGFAYNFNNAAANWQVSAYPVTAGGVDGTISGELLFFNPGKTVSVKCMRGQVTQYYTPDAGVTRTTAVSTLSGAVINSTAATVIRFTLSAGSFNAGEFKLYGIRS